MACCVRAAVRVRRDSAGCRAGQGRQAGSGQDGRAAKAAPAKPVEAPLAEADTEQIDAAERVYYGIYDCEFNQTVDIEKHPKHAAYVDVKHGQVELADEAGAVVDRRDPARGRQGRDADGADRRASRCC